MKRLIPILMAVGVLAGPAHAEWKPNGPIKFWIGFGAGGGTDTQARTLAGELEKLKGWRIIPVNKAGGGGTVMAAQLKKRSCRRPDSGSGNQHDLRLRNPEK